MLAYGYSSADKVETHYPGPCRTSLSSQKTKSDGALPVPPFPQDAQMFFGIGAQKAGTTWLHDYLSRSHQVHFSRNKELHYFDVRAGRAGMALRMRVGSIRVLADKLDPNNIRLNRAVVDRLCDAPELLKNYTGKGRGADRHDPYLEYRLQDRQGQPLVGDITPSSAVLNRQHFTDMASIERAKFIFILRDPATRMWSHIRMNAAAKVGANAAPEVMVKACRDWVDSLVQKSKLADIERSDYMRTMIELEALVPSDRILYVFYEDFFEGPATQMVCDFLGIPHTAPEGGR